MKIPVVTACLVAVSFGAPLQAQDLQIPMDATLDCLEASDADSHSCIGAAAAVCMDETEGGGSTVGMAACLWSEYTYWDARLNDSYQRISAVALAADAETAKIGATAPSQSDTLRAMQRAWIPYRDAACDYEAALWGGGTGTGGATAECLMQLTAQQTLRIEEGLN